MAGDGNPRVVTFGSLCQRDVVIWNGKSYEVLSSTTPHGIRWTGVDRVTVLRLKPVVMGWFKGVIKVTRRSDEPISRIRSA